MVIYLWYNYTCKNQKKQEGEVIKLKFNIEISSEQAELFAMEIYYGSDLVTDIKKYIADNQESYEEFLEEERVRHNG